MINLPSIIPPPPLPHKTTTPPKQRTSSFTPSLTSTLILQKTHIMYTSQALKPCVHMHNPSFIKCSQVNFLLNYIRS